MYNREHRKFSRIPSEARLEIHHPALGILHLRAHNASAGGFFAAKGVEALPPVGTLVEVYIKRHTGTLHAQPVQMRVVHVNNNGMGLEFVY